MAYKGIHEFTSQALIIEDAESEILAYTKRAVLECHTKDRFKTEVDKIIDKHLERLTSEELRGKAKEGLRLYAQKTFKRQRDLLLLHVAFFAVLIIGKREKKAEVRPFLREFERNVGKEYRASQGFKRALEADLSQASYPSRLPLDIYHKRYMKRVEEVTEELITSGAKEDYASNVSLRNIAEMTVRYEHQTEMIDELRKRSVRLVYILPHANCSKRCEKYQVGGSLHPSGLYSLDGSSGTTAEGVPFKPLSFATDNPIDLYTTKAGKTYQNGCITGFNCRHKLGEYIPGVRPKPIPKSVIEKRRAIEMTQREYEREIRNYKKAAVLATNEKDRNKYLWAAKETNKKYKDFSVKNNVAWYPERVKIFDNENSPLTETEKRGIMSKNNRRVRKWYIDRISTIPDKINRNEPVESQAREAHQARNSMKKLARDRMIDKDTREYLDKYKPIKSFRETVEYVMDKYHCSKEEAYEIIIGSSARSNKEVNKSLHL